MKKFSSLEVVLSVIVVLLLICSIGLGVINFLCVNEKGADEGQLYGQMVISEGAVFSENLLNSSSTQFKSLAFDVQHLVGEAFTLTDLRLQFRSCSVLLFRKGSVVVTLDLRFLLPVSAQEVQLQLVEGLKLVQDPGLVIDSSSVKVTEPGDVGTTPGAVTTAQPSTSTPVSCPEGHMICSDGSGCVLIGRFCDGLRDCSDGSDEDQHMCSTPCDGQFELHGPNGSFTSSEGEIYTNSTSCRWIIRVEPGLSIRLDFMFFQTEGGRDFLRLYEGVGPDRKMIADLSGSIPAGRVWLLSNQLTAEFVSDDQGEERGFRATFTAINLTEVSNEVRLSCSFEDGWCLWRQDPDQDYQWVRIRGSPNPPETGPSVDHTTGNNSGYYVSTFFSPGSWLKTYRMMSLPLRPLSSPSCLSFWYHMYGEDVFVLRVLLVQGSEQVLFQREGNYGDSWYQGQIEISENYTNGQIVFEAQKNSGILNDIALDDITLTSLPCGPSPPEPTNVPPPTTPAPIPVDCGGPFNLFNNATFSSPKYPDYYGDKADCLWRLHADAGKNIQLHFLDFDLEATYDTLEIRDGPDLESTLLGVFTGSKGPTNDLFSSTNEMSLWFLTDSSTFGRGFKANFTSGVNLGSPEPCSRDQFQCRSGFCVSSDSECNGRMDCADGSDEEHCVFLGVDHLEMQIISSNFSVCSSNWTNLLSDFTCRYLGYRSGMWSTISSGPEDAPFVSVSVSNNSIITSPVTSCDSMVSLNCSNQPCGVPQVNLTSDQSEPKQGTVSLSEQADSGNGKIVGGVNAAKGAWPWMVSLHWFNRHVCGGTLIGRDWILTAAHCVYGKNVHVANWRALFGLTAQSESNAPEVQSRLIRRIVIHPWYNRRTKRADIAMMQLQEPVNFSDHVQPVCLPEPGLDPAPGTVCTISGWGRLQSGGSLPDVLQEALVPLVPLSQCQEQLPQYNITELMMCAGREEGGVDTCQGDSGGPLMLQRSGHWTQIGVTSFGVGCGNPLSPGVYARVSAFTSWIAQTRRSHHGTTTVL